MCAHLTFKSITVDIDASITPYVFFGALFCTYSRYAVVALEETMALHPHLNLTDFQRVGFSQPRVYNDDWIIMEELRCPYYTIARLLQNTDKLQYRMEIIGT